MRFGRYRSGRWLAQQRVQKQQYRDGALEVGTVRQWGQTAESIWGFQRQEKTWIGLTDEYCHGVLIQRAQNSQIRGLRSRDLALSFGLCGGLFRVDARGIGVAGDIECVLVGDCGRLVQLYARAVIAFQQTRGESATLIGHQVLNGSQRRFTLRTIISSETPSTRLKVVS